MTNRGAIRRFFAGTSTASGFVSFFDHILPVEAAERYLILKGGPGVGKAHLIRRFGERLTAAGHDVEYIHCASDPDSLDGVHAPALRIAMVDGTAPHVIEPRLPGIADEIVHLGRFWHQPTLRANKQRIERLFAANGRCYPHVYRWLAAAKLFRDEREAFAADAAAVDARGLHRLTRQLLAELPDGATGDRLGRERRLFASAVTPAGLRNHFDTLFAPLTTRIVLETHWALPAQAVTTALRDAALARGLDVETFYDALDATRLEHLIIPEHAFGVITSHALHAWSSRSGDRVIALHAYVDEARLKPYAAQADRAAALFRQALDAAVDWLAQAKAIHDQLEAEYVQAMDFAALDRAGERLLAELLG